ncbi:hypothetical protein PsorP6_017433 [Peronosclerospora sorghi]|uniref:Uncharacterized protein n=1 Tax=Peronosclerospora sorghi TaxID=230839 RepID=A0ACC0WP64_9STRA|nr:hypothetical protein PsorP6_017433 [Peronosclerospora sorghi]
MVLVRCPGCENLHLVADRLVWFEDDSTDVESLMEFVRAKSVWIADLKCAHGYAHRSSPAPLPPVDQGIFLDDTLDEEAFIRMLEEAFQHHVAQLEAHSFVLRPPSDLRLAWRRGSHADPVAFVAA